MKFKQWFRKWLMFAVALLIGNKIYGSKFDDGISWITKKYGSKQLPIYNDLTVDFMRGGK